VLALIFLSAFALFQYFESRKKAYLFYGLYMICMALYFVRVLEYHFGEPVFWGFFYSGYGLAEIVALMLSYVMYVQFTRHFLGIDRSHRILHRTIRIWIAVCLLIAGVGVSLSMLHISSALFLQLYTLLRFAMPVIVVFFLWQIIRARLPYSRYVVLGTVFLLLGGLLALIVTFIFRDFGSILLREPFFYMLSGVLLESFAFALGLGKQTRQTELEKIATQQQLIVQLQKEAQLERDIRETQVQALRAQMNPHFIFNALNSVQHFILDNQKENSIKYLSRVSQLIRRILQNSTLPNIQLDEEIESIKAYVDIEQLRFHPAFSFICTIDENLDIEMIRIPHLMIQPFVENAILHGLVHKKGQGILTLEIKSYKEDIAIEVIITDNGIGREEARKIAAQNPRKHNSISMGSIEARIRLLMPDEKDPVRIEDLKDQDGAAAGTRVRLKVPVV
jgi:sensor histidine kinase YesM